MEIQIPSLLRIKPRALNKLGKYLRKNGMDRVVVYYGKGIPESVVETIAISLDSSEITIAAEEIVSGNSIQDVVRSAFSLPRAAQGIVAVGGGLAIDFGKYAGFLTRIPVIAVPTAISNDGFGSPGASLLVNGKRTSCQAAMPFGVVIDTEVIRKSPVQFTFSGIGDLIAKFSSVADWKASYRATGEPVNDFAAMISERGVTNLINHPVRNIEDLGFLRMVAGTLVISGEAMEISGSSRPASGSEHLISHAYDDIAARPLQHGLQVGVATLGTAWLQESEDLPKIHNFFEETGFTAFMSQNKLHKESFLKAIKDAPGVKPGYYTVLSQPGAVERLQEYISSDPMWDTYLYSDPS